MAGLRNFQRRALESLVNMGASVITTRLEGAKFYLDETPIYFLGVSTGIGTCSDMHGLDIAVFANFPPIGKPRGNMKSCLYAALLRSSTEEEKQQQACPDLAYMTVEGLEVVKQEWNYVVFKQGGTKAIYVNAF